MTRYKKQYTDVSFHSKLSPGDKKKKQKLYSKFTEQNHTSFLESSRSFLPI